MSIFGSKFKTKTLNAFGKCVADYYHSSGEIVLSFNKVEGIPLKSEIDTSKKYVPGELSDSEIRLMFDFGVVWCLAVIFLRDEEGIEPDSSEFMKNLDEFMHEGLKYVSKHDYEFEYGLSVSKIAKAIMTADWSYRNEDKDNPFNKGVNFAGIFLKEFYKVKFVEE
jgi:hypothetical protein